MQKCNTAEKSAPSATFKKGDECSFLTEKESIDLIKIDVEGAELEVLKGLEKTIKKHHPLLKIEFKPAACSAANITFQDIWDYLVELGYQKYSFPSKK